MKKKTVSLLLSLAMCLTMLPGQSVFAAETSTETETEAASESTGNHVENLIVGTIADQNVINYPGASTQVLCSVPTSPLTELAISTCYHK